MLHVRLRIGVWLVLLFLSIGSATGQTWGPKDPFRLSVDVARCRGGEDTLSSVEMYYTFSRHSLTYTLDSAGYSGGADITVFIRKADSLVYADRWIVPYTVRDTATVAAGMSLVGTYKLHLAAGDYLFKVLGRDKNDTRRIDSVMLRVPVHLYPVGKPTLSDLQFASTIRPGVKGGLFYKNTLDVIPNVGGFYTEGQSCFYYAEAYNLMMGDDTSKYTIRMNVFDAVGKELTSRERPRRRQSESAVLVDNFPVASLRTGTYALMLSLVDTAKKVFASSARKFFVLNKNLGVDSSMLTSTAGLPLPEYASMDESELDREFQWARWEMTSAEKDQYALLKGIDPKRRSMTDFWRRRGPGFREEYLSRVAYANSNFRMMNRDGYRADRGRVYIVYGIPDELERHPNETDTRPYEIWFYHNIQGGVEFDFVQKSVGGDYELVNSTHRNELHDPNWMATASAR
jgi:GWxTD domain-containing protein